MAIGNKIKCFIFQHLQFASTYFVILILPMLGVFQQDETVFVTPTVLEVRLPILATLPQLLIYTTEFDTKLRK